MASHFNHILSLSFVLVVSGCLSSGSVSETERSEMIKYKNLNLEIINSKERILKSGTCNNNEFRIILSKLSEIRKGYYAYNAKYKDSLRYRNLYSSNKRSFYRIIREYILETYGTSTRNAAIFAAEQGRHDYARTITNVMALY